MPRESESPLISHSHGREARIMYLVGSQRLRAAGVRRPMAYSPRLPCATWLVARGARSPVRAGRVRSGEPERYVVSGFCLSFGSPLRGTVVRRRPWRTPARAGAAPRGRGGHGALALFSTSPAQAVRRGITTSEQMPAGHVRAGRGPGSGRHVRVAVASRGARGAVRSPKLQKEAKSQRPNEPRRHPTIRICCNHS